MSPHAGEMLCTEVVPRIQTAIRASTRMIGAEGVSELIQDTIATAAAMLHRAEAAKKSVTASTVAYFAVKLTKSGRRSTSSNKTDGRREPAGQLGTVPSSARFKEEIQDMGDESAALLSLRPVTFRYKKAFEPAGRTQFGLVAEEVSAVDPRLVVRDASNQIYSVRYEAVNAMLLNEFLKQHKTMEEQSAEIRKQQQEIAALLDKASAVDDLEQRLGQLEKICQSTSR